MHRFFLFLIVWGISASAHATQHVRVVWKENPHHEATVSFTTQDANASLYVNFGTSVAVKNDRSSYAKTVASNSTQTYFGSKLYVHHIELTDLKPSSDVWFQIEGDGAMSREYYFTTAPADDRPFRILYGGDSRTNIEGRRAVNRLIAQTVESDPGILAFAHGGDYVGIGEFWGQWNQWLGDHQLTIAKDGRILPMIPARGNHEFDGMLYNQVFNDPGVPGHDFWQTKIGTDLVWITLDTNSSLAGRQSTFLETTLKEAQAHRWIVANYHRPAFPAVKSIGPAYEHFVPLFEKYNVDFVCESDGHVLKRTVPIRNGLMDPTGVVYVGEGGLGVKQRTPDSKRWYLQPPGMTMSAHHIQIFSFSPSGVDYRAVGLDGKTLDTYSFVPKREGKVSPPEIASTKLDLGGTLTVRFSEPINRLSLNAPGHVSVAASHAIETMTLDKQTVTMRVTGDLESLQLKVHGIEDLAGNVIDRYVIGFEGTSFPRAGTVIEKRPTPQPKVAVLKPVEPKKSDAPIEPPVSRCSTVGPGSASLWFLLLLFARRRKKIAS